MRVLITGGSGLIGRALTENLVLDNHEVIIVSRTPETIMNLPSGVTAIGWDKKTLVKHMENVNAAVNLAGASIAGESPLKMRWSPKRKHRILQSRVDAGNKLSEAIKTVNKKPEVLIQSSAVGYYGPLSDELVDENFPSGNDFLADVCQQWEDSTQPVESLGIRRPIVRTGLVFSSQGGIFPLLKLPFSLYVGGPLGNGKQYLSWIHIDDVVQAIRFLIDNQTAQGIFNLSSPNPVTNKDFGAILGKAMKRPSLFPVPSFAMKAALGETATLSLDGQRVMPKRLLETGYNFKYSTLEGSFVSLLNPILNFKHEFQVNATLQQVVDFHRDTIVLKKLTPFPIIVQFRQVEPVGEGTQALFTLWFGPIPVTWHANHHDFNLPNSFFDTQVEGPFNLWVHQHSFNKIDDKMTEVVDDIDVQFGTGLFSGLVSRFMWITLPILFAYRAWQTKRLLEMNTQKLLHQS
ncbi:MAG: TIGR01777 family protein [Anaerolineae bacterium]|nr:TIGR01777 family protein [Anaerolineae bacterium]